MAYLSCLNHLVLPLLTFHKSLIQLRIHLSTPFGGIDRCHKGLEIDHGVILDVNVKVIFEHPDGPIKPLDCYFAPDSEAVLSFWCVAIILWNNIFAGSPSL